jgi:uncharacterized membrane protein
MKRIYIVFSIMLLSACLYLSFSPLNLFPKNERFEIKNTIIIKAPAEKIFGYLGHSANACNWSTYVDHIKPLNQSVIADGKIGSIRRCFKNNAEIGIQWDEQIIGLKKNKYRQISIYNMNGFLMQSNALYTEQVYKTINDSTTALTFTLSLRKDAELLDVLKLHFGAYRISRIFKANLKNIKYYNES